MKCVLFNRAIYWRTGVLLFLSFFIHCNILASYTFTAGSTILNLGQSLRLQNGQYDLILQGDNNLVLYQWNIPRWSTNTVGTGAVKMMLQTDGDLVLLTAANGIVWRSNTSGNLNAVFIFRDSGSLVVNNSVSVQVWNSGTAATSNYSAYVNANATGAPAGSHIITPLYPTEDVVVADFDVVADVAGIVDASAAIQTVLNNCSAAGGGTVWLSAGNYRIRNPINVPAHCTLRGDWRDPDDGGSFTNTADYGTMILVDFSAGVNGSNVFTINSSAGVMGLTIYYPHQNAHKPVPYNFAIKCIGAQASTVKNITLINAYQGIATLSTPAHELYTFKNIRGCCLNIGIYAGNSADVGVWENISLSNKYWAQAPAMLNPPSIDTLNARTLSAGTGIQLADLEWDQFLKINVSNYQMGLDVITGARTHFVGAFSDCVIDSCITAVQLDDYDTRWGPSFVNSKFQGAAFAIKNNVGYSATAHILFNHCTFIGAVTGANIVQSSLPAANPSPYVSIAAPNIPRAGRQVFYNVAAAPYNAPRVKGNTNGSLPTADAAPAIQQALNQAGADGGGIVYVPGGWYRIDGVLTVPANVELRGVASLPVRDVNPGADGSNGGTSFFVANGHNSATPDIATACITLNGRLSGVSGIKFFYPGRNFAYSGGDVPYPYTIRGNGKLNFIRNISFQNVYNGIDLAANSCDSFYIERTQGMCTSSFIQVGGSGNIYGNIKNILSNGNYAVRVPYKVHNWPVEANLFAQIIDNITRKKEYLLKINQSGASGSVNLQICNVFGYGLFSAIKTDKDGTVVYNMGADNLGPGGYVITATEHIIISNVLRYNGDGSTLGIAPNGYIQLYNDNILQ